MVRTVPVSTEYLPPRSDDANQIALTEDTAKDSIDGTGRDFLATLPPKCDEVELTLVTSMATWCSSCKKHIATLQHLKSQFPADSLFLLGLPVDEADNGEKLAEYQRLYKPPYEILSDWTPELRGEAKRRMREHVGSEVLPTTMVVNHRRDIVAITQGVPSVSELRKLMHHSRLLSSTVADRR